MEARYYLATVTAFPLRVASPTTTAVVLLIMTIRSAEREVGHSTQTDCPGTTFIPPILLSPVPRRTVYTAAERFTGVEVSLSVRRRAYSAILNIESEDVEDLMP